MKTMKVFVFISILVVIYFTMSILLSTPVKLDKVLVTCPGPMPCTNPLFNPSKHSMSEYYIQPGESIEVELE